MSESEHYFGGDADQPAWTVIPDGGQFAKRRSGSADMDRIIWPGEDQRRVWRRLTPSFSDQINRPLMLGGSTAFGPAEY
jgi:hypothetical protein